MRSSVVVAWLIVPTLAAADERYYDFRPGGEGAEREELLMFGPNADKYLSFEKGGLHIRVPPERDKYVPLGLEMYLVLRGNFEVTVGYSLLAVGEPKKPYGAGLVVFLRSRFVPYHEALIGRFRKVKGEVFSANRHDSDAPPRWQAEPTGERSGFLRLARVKEEIAYQVAGDDGKFREIWRQDFPDKDIGILRLSANTGQDHVELDATIRDLRIRADGIFDRDAVPPTPAAAAVTKMRAAEPAAAPLANPAEPTPPSNRWRLAWVLALLALAALLPLAWLARRRTKEGAASDDSV